ncbi:MAG: hypothetical protein IT385_26005 [Deltaproteobacteria bacterium]|nr:hypothetical protein [Deltaproteobacteria bacterium]
MIAAWIAVAVLAGDDDLLIVDAPPEARSPWSWSLRTLALLGADLVAEPGEDTLATTLELAPALAFEPSPRWDARVRLRLRHRLGARPGAARHDLDVDPLEARVRWRPDGGPEVTLGWIDDTRWPELASPHPLDLALGPLPASGEAGDRRRAIPALHLSHTLGPARVELLWQPLHVPMRVPLAGSDWAPFEVEGADELADLARADGLGGGSAGARVRLRGARWDLGLTWLWRPDPIPDASGATRQHRVAADLGATTGPLAWRLEVAGVDRHNGWTTARAPAHAAALEALVGVSSAPTIFLELEVHLRLLHALGAEGRWLGGGPRDLDLAGRVGLLLAWDGVLRLDVEGRVGLMRPDGDLALALALRASPRDEVALGLTIFEGAAVAAGRGALYDADDALWVRWIRAW